MKILALESSAGPASACVMEDGRVLGEFYVNIRQTHSQTLMVMAKGVLECTGTALEDIDLFAVAAGPGSFTGVRIGVASIKGMAMALGKPCAGVSTLAAMAENLRDLEGTVCCVMDARCQQVYNALFRVENGRAARLTEDRAISVAALAAECALLPGPVYLAGDGALLCSQSPSFAALAHVKLTEESLRYQRSSGVARAAMAMADAGKTVSAAELLPVYLRLPQAERELKRKQNQMEEKQTL